MSGNNSNGNGRGALYSLVSSDEVSRPEFTDLESKVDGLLDDTRLINGKLDGLTKKGTEHSSKIAQVNATLKAQGEEIATIGAALIRIETKLGTTVSKLEKVEDLAEEADQKAERASFSNETDRELAAIAVEERKLSLYAKKANLESDLKTREVARSAFTGALLGAGAAIKNTLGSAKDVAVKIVTLAATGIAAILVASLAQRCGVDVPGLEKATPAVSASAEAPDVP